MSSSRSCTSLIPLQHSDYWRRRFCTSHGSFLHIPRMAAWVPLAGCNSVNSLLNLSRTVNYYGWDVPYINTVMIAILSLNMFCLIFTFPSAIEPCIPNISLKRSSILAIDVLSAGRSARKSQRDEEKHFDKGINVFSNDLNIIGIPKKLKMTLKYLSWRNLWWNDLKKPNFVFIEHLKGGICIH